MPACSARLSASGCVAADASSAPCPEGLGEWVNAPVLFDCFLDLGQQREGSQRRTWECSAHAWKESRGEARPCLCVWTRWSRSLVSSSFPVWQVPVVFHVFHEKVGSRGALMPFSSPEAKFLLRRQASGPLLSSDCFCYLEGNR